MSNSTELAFDISSNIPEVVAGAVQALGLLGKAATDAGAAVGSAGKKTAGSTKSMRDSVEALKMMAYELSEESKRLGDTQASSAAKLRAMAGAIQASSDRMSDAISTMSKAAGILNRQEVSASSITKWAGLAKIAAADFSEALKSAGAEVAKFKAMTSFDPAAHSKVFGMGRDTIRQATVDTKRELAGHYNALGVFISNGQAKLAADLAKSASAHTAATAEMRARAVAEWSAANKALKSSAFGLGRDTIRQATADTKRELAGHYNALGVFISNAQTELAAKASAGTAANAAVQAKALGLGRDTIRQATADTKRELAGHYNALGMFISNAATPAAAAAPSASEIAASAKRSKVEVEALSKSLRHLTIDGNDAHSMARGLASGFNLLWLTWGNLAPLFAGSAISFGVSRTFSIGMEVEQNIKFLEVLGDKTKEQGSVIREELRKIDQSTLFSLTELSKAMVGLEQGGVSGARGLEVVKVAADLAAVGNTNLDVTSRLLMQTMNLFPQTTADVTKSAAQMFQVTKDGALNIEDIGDAMKYASTSGVVYGQTFEDVLVTLKALAAGGIKGTSAGTSWINFLQDLAGRSKPAKAALKELEVALGRTISTFDSKGQARAALDVLSDINEGLSKFKPQAAKELMDRIFNERGIRTAAAAIRDGTVDLGKYKEMLGEVKGEFLTTNAAQLMDTTKGALDILKGTMVGVLDKTFESMGTGFRDTIKNLTSTINSDEFANLMRGMVGSFAALADVAVRVLPELSNIAAILIAFKSVSFAQAAVSGLAASMVPLIGYLSQGAYGMGLMAGRATAGAMSVTGLGQSMLMAAAASKATAAGLDATAAQAAAATVKVAATTGATRLLAMTMGFLANPIVGLVTTLGILGATWWATSQSSQTASEELSAKVWKDGKLNIKVLDEEIAKIKERDAVRAAGMEAPTTELDSLLAEAKAKWDKSRELRRKLEGPGLTEQQKSSRAPFMPKALADETQAHEAWFTLYTRRQEVLDNKAKLQAETEKKRNAGVKAATEKAEADAKRQLSGLDRLGKEGTAQQAAQNKLDNDLRYNHLDEIAKADKTELDGLRSHLNSQTEALKDFRDANLMAEGDYQNSLLTVMEAGNKLQREQIEAGTVKYANEIGKLMSGLAAMPKTEISDSDKANRFQELIAKLHAYLEQRNTDIAKMDEEAAKRERKLYVDQYKELDKLRKGNEEAVAASKDRVQAILDEGQAADRTQGLGGVELEAAQARIKVEMDGKKQLRQMDKAAAEQAQISITLRAHAAKTADEEVLKALLAGAEHYDGIVKTLIEGRTALEVQLQSEAAVTVAAVYRKEFKRRTDELATTLSDALVDTLMNAGKEGGRNLRRTLEQELLAKPFRMVVQALIQPFAQQAAAGINNFLGVPGGSGGSGGSLTQYGSNLLGSSSLFTSSSAYGSILGSSGSQAAMLAAQTSGFAGSQAAMLAAQTGEFGAAGLALTAEAAGTAATAAGTAATAATTATGAATTIASAVPYVAAFVAVASLLSSLDDSGTLHTGGLGSYSRAGGAAYGDTVKSQGLKFDLASKDYSAATAQASVAIATSVANMLDQTANAFGQQAGYFAATAFADDSSKDGAWGALMVKLADQTLIDWKGGNDKWPGREFADGEAGAKEYAAAIGKDMRDYLVTQTPDWADSMLMALGDAPSLEGVVETAGKINQAAKMLEVMGRDKLTDTGAAAFEQLQEQYGWWSAEQRAQIAILNAQGKSQEALNRQRELDIALLSEGEKASRRRVFALEDQVTRETQLAGLTDRWNAASMTKTQLLEKEAEQYDQSNVGLLYAVATLEEGKELQQRLNEATMTRTELLALERAQILPGNQALFDAVQLAEEQKDLQQRLNEATMTRTELLALERAQILPGNQALFDSVQLAEERKSLDQRLNEATMTRTELLALERAQILPGNQALFDSVQLAEERKSLDQRLNEATMTRTELLALERAQILPGNQALFDSVQLAEERKSLDQRLNEATMTRTELLALERAQILPGNQALFDSVQLAEEQKEVLSQVNTLTMSRVQLLDLERANLLPANRALFDYAQSLGQVSEAKNLMVDALNDVVSSFSSLLESFTKFQSELATTHSLLSPQESYRESRKGLDKTYAAAVAGDKEALKALEGDASKFLEASKGYNASSSAYFADLATVKEMVAKAKDLTGSGLTDAEKQLAALGELNTSVESLSSAMVAYTESISTAITVDLAAQLRQIDTDGNSAVSMREMVAKFSGLASESTLSKVFSLIDADGDGQITLLETISSNTGGTKAAIAGLGAVIAQLQAGTISSAAAASTIADLTKAPGTTSTGAPATSNTTTGVNTSSGSQNVHISSGGAVSVGDTIYGTSGNSIGVQQAISNVNKAIASGDLYSIYHAAIADGISASSLDAMMGWSHGSSNTWAKSVGLPMFARGGFHAGGMRLVGENGPELEVTGASRIYSAQQTRNLLADYSSQGADNAELVAELRALRAQVERLEQHAAANVRVAQAVGKAQIETLEVIADASTDSAKSQRLMELAR